MPWCEPCAKYFAPSSLTDTGQCPKCGISPTVADVHGRVDANNLNLRSLATRGTADESGDDEKAPWHFKLLVGMLIIYLCWRFVQIFA